MQINTMAAQPMSDYGQELEELQRRQKYAEMLREQSMQAPQAPEAKGRLSAPTHWTQLAAGLLKNASALSQQQEGHKERKALSQRYQDESQKNLAEALMMARGRAGQGVMPTGTEADQYDQTPYQAPVPPDAMGAMGTLARNPNPVMQSAGTTGLVQSMMPKTVSPDALLRAQTELTKHGTPSANATMQEGGRNTRHADPSGDARMRQDWTERTWPLEQGVRLGHLANEGLRTGVDLAQARFGLPETSGIGGGVGRPMPVQAPASAIPPRPGQPPMVQGAPFASTPTPRAAPMAPQQVPPRAPAPAPSPAPAQATPQPQTNVPLMINPTVSPRERQKLVLEQPQAEVLAKSTMDMSQTALPIINSILTNKNLGNVTGSIGGRTPSVLPQSVTADRDIDALKRVVSIAALQKMRDMSKTGGAVGQVTEREWEFLAQTMGTLSQAQDKATFGKALRDLKGSFMRVQESAKGVYEKTYGPLKWEPVETERGKEDLGGWKDV